MLCGVTSFFLCVSEYHPNIKSGTFSALSIHLDMTFSLQRVDFWTDDFVSYGGPCSSGRWGWIGKLDSSTKKLFLCMQTQTARTETVVWDENPSTRAKLSTPIFLQI